MRKVNLLRCDVARDASMQDLFSELRDTRVALSQAYARFNAVCAPELVDACVYEINAELSRYDYLLRQIKERSGEAVYKMGITEKILLVLFAVFALLAVLRLFAAPLKLAGKLLVNTLLGFALLGILSALGVLAKLSLGLNLFNALVIAVLGVPGLALLILLRLVFI